MHAAYGAERSAEIMKVARHNTVYYPSLTIKGAIQSIRVVRPIAVDKTVIESWTFRLKGAPDALLARTVTYNRLINSPFSVVGHDDLHAYRAIQKGLHASGNPWVSLQRDFDPAEIGAGRGHGDRHERDLDAQPVPRLGAVHDGDDVSDDQQRRSDRTRADRLRRPRGAPARRQALRRVARPLDRRRHLLGAADARAERRHPPQLAPLRGQAAAHAARRAAEEPARLLAAAAEPRPAPAADADARVERRRARSASCCARRSTTPRRRATRSRSFVGTAFHHLVRDGGGAAPAPEAGRPPQRRGRAARRPALHMNAPTATVYDAFRRIAARRGDAEFLCVEAVTAAAYGIDAGPRSWREVAGEVERLRAAYAQAGYGHGHRVGLLLENRPAFFTHWLALNSLGISIVPIHADLRPARVDVPDRPQRDVAGGDAAGTRGRRCAPPRPRPASTSTRSGPRSPVASRRRARRRASRASRSAAAPSARCSTPRGRPGGRRAAASPTATSCAPASGTSACTSSPRSCPTSTASSRRCRSAT